MPSLPPVSAMPRGVVGVLLAALLVPVGVLAPAPAARAATGTRVIDGPDVASYQHPYGKRIEWRRVARDGKEFAIVKATEGTSYRNPWFGRDYTGARRAGLVRGSYHFARPQYPIVQSARAQARYYARRLGDSPKRRKTLPPALDLEVTGGLGPAALVTWAQTFQLELRRRTHRTPMIYTYPYFWTSALGDPAALSRYRLWMASYSSRPAVPHALWQYTSSARVRGIVGGVDMSRFVGDRADWRRLADGTRTDRWPAQAPGAPQRVSVSYGGGAATVRWMPGDTGSTDVRSYVVSVAGGATVTVDATTFAATLPGLERGKTYTVSVAARNAVGRGTWARLSYTVPLLRARLDVQRPAAVVYGDDGVVRARLTNASTGAPLAGRHVTVAQRPVGSATWQPLPDLVTDDRGRVVLRLTDPAQSLEVQLSFAASGWAPVAGTVTLPVRSAVSAALDPDLLAPGGYSLHGTVAPAVAGATVRHQELVSGVWQTVTTTTTLLDGSYTFAFVPAPGEHRYRVVADPVGGRWRGFSAELLLSVE